MANAAQALVDYFRHSPMRMFVEDMVGTEVIEHAQFRFNRLVDKVTVRLSHATLGELPEFVAEEITLVDLVDYASGKTGEDILEVMPEPREVRRRLMTPGGEVYMTVAVLWPDPSTLLVTVGIVRSMRAEARRLLSKISMTSEDLAAFKRGHLTTESGNNND